MRLHESPDKLEFQYDWYKVKYVIALIAAPVFSFFLIQSELITGDFNDLTSPVYVLLIFTLVTMYYSLAKTINTTDIHVSHEEIEVKHGPIPFSRNLHLKKEEVTQLYVTQHRIGHRYYLYSTTYQICVILKSEEVITLVKGLHTTAQGRFIEHKIEDFLNITDIHVEGELAKD